MADPAPKPGATAVFTQLGQLWSRQSRGVRLLAILVVVGVLGFVVVTNVLAKTESFLAALADGASPDDSQELLSALQARGVSARLKDGKVEVATGDLENARAVAAAAGLPHGGKGFEIFDGSNLGQSSFAEQVNYRRALQGELQRSIAALAQVQGARVHIALGHHSVFKDQSERPTASRRSLAATQARRSSAPSKCAACASSSPPASRVARHLRRCVVVGSCCNHGNLLDATAPGATDQKAEIEHSVATRVRTMLERVVGHGKVSVVATAAVDERKVSETSETYDNDHPRRAQRDALDRWRRREPAQRDSRRGVAGARAATRRAQRRARRRRPHMESQPPQRDQQGYEISRTSQRQTKRVRAAPEDPGRGRGGLRRRQGRQAAVARTDKEMSELHGARAPGRRHRRRARRQDRDALDRVRAGSRGHRAAAAGRWCRPAGLADHLHRRGRVVAGSSCS